MLMAAKFEFVAFWSIITCRLVDMLTKVPQKIFVSTLYREAVGIIYVL
jgi:hypothetical protein